MNSDKNRFREFCKSNPSLPIFMHSWWLDTVAGENNWDVVVIEKDNCLHACFPYIIKKAGIWKAIGMPALTPFIGLWINYPDIQSENNRIGLEKKLITRIIDALPAHDKFFMKFDHTLTNWLPFYWKGFKASTQYTYIIDNLKDIEKVYSMIKPNIKGHINKAKEYVQITISNDVDKLYKLSELPFKRQRKNAPFKKELIQKIYQAATDNKCGQIFIAEDSKNNTHAASFIVWDKSRAYYLLGGVDPELKSSSANSLLMWKTIQFASTVSEKFDFEGSMIQAVEQFFRDFGTTQKPYFLITKTNSKILSVIEYLRSLY